jgi:hypothetical protein
MPLVYVKKENYFLLIAPQLSLLWCLYRLFRITATGISKIMGVNNVTANEYKEELINSSDSENFDTTSSGVLAEPILREYYKKQNPHIKLWQIGMCIPADKQHLCGSPDDFAYDPTEREGMREGIVEYKTTRKNKLLKEPQNLWLYQTKSMMGMSKRHWVDIVHACVDENNQVIESWTKRKYFIPYEWDNILLPESDRFYNNILAPAYAEKEIKMKPLIADLTFESFDELTKIWERFNCSVDVSTSELHKELEKENEVWETVGVSNKRKKSPIILPVVNKTSETTLNMNLLPSLEIVDGPVNMMCNNFVSYPIKNNIHSKTMKSESLIKYTPTGASTSVLTKKMITKTPQNVSSKVNTEGNEIICKLPYNKKINKNSPKLISIQNMLVNQMSITASKS